MMEVWTLFCKSLFYHAEGDKVLLKMYDKIPAGGKSVDKLVTLVWDGPNVNKTIFWKMNELISQHYPESLGQIDFGSCTIHIVHGAFGNGIEIYGRYIDLLCMDLHLLFKHSSVRGEDFKEVQKEMEVELHNFQQCTVIWWLSMVPAIKRILNWWEAIIQFTAELAKMSKKVSKSINYKRV